MRLGVCDLVVTGLPLDILNFWPHSTIFILLSATLGLLIHHVQYNFPYTGNSYNIFVYFTMLLWWFKMIWLDYIIAKETVTRTHSEFNTYLHISQSENFTENNLNTKYYITAPHFQLKCPMHSIRWIWYIEPVFFIHKKYYLIQPVSLHKNCIFPNSVKIMEILKIIKALFKLYEN